MSCVDDSCVVQLFILLFRSFDGSTAWHLFSSSYFHRAFLYNAKERALFKSVQITDCTICTTAIFNWRRFGTTEEEREGREIKSKQIHALVFSLWLCSAVLRTERDRVGEGKWDREDRKRRRAEKTIDTENTLLLILSEGHSHSLQFQPAACLISHQQRGTGCSRTNTHGENKL